MLAMTSNTQHRRVENLMRRLLLGSFRADKSFTANSVQCTPHTNSVRIVTVMVRGERQEHVSYEYICQIKQKAVHLLAIAVWRNGFNVQRPDVMKR